jgi:signal transduction histidine kinase
LRAIAQNGTDSRAAAAAPAITGVSDEQQVLLSTLPPSRGQKRLALVLVLVLLAAFCATLPFATAPLGYIREFIPAYAAAMFVISAITSALLFVQFSVVHSRALLAVSGGYLFSALMAIPWALTFPDLFGETDMTSTTWGLLSRIWHLGFPLFVIGYTLLKDDDAGTQSPPRPLSFAVLLGAAGVVVAMDLVAWLATTTNEPSPSALPVSMLFERSQTYWNGLLVLIVLFALALLWSRRRSVLDLWLMVVLCGLVIELCLIILVGRRYVIGWYAARIYFLISATFVLAILLSETALLYARLARSVMAQRREREARLMTLDVLSASIAHEMRQPLASIVTNVDAASRWMGRPTPDLDEVKATLEQIRNSAYRARDLIGSIRAMVKRDERNRAALTLNDLVHEVLALMKAELRRNRISVELELDEHLPSTNGHRIQLQQVLTNLITNAIDAMTEKKGSRILRIKSAIQEPRDRRSYFQSVVHDQVRRHGAGLIDLPIDYRGARRSTLGIGRRSRRLGLSIRSARQRRSVAKRLLSILAAKAWSNHSFSSVMAALIAGIHVSVAAQPQIKTWMAGTKPGHDLSAFAPRNRRRP